VLYRSFPHHIAGSSRSGPPGYVLPCRHKSCQRNCVPAETATAIPQTASRRRSDAHPAPDVMDKPTCMRYDRCRSGASPKRPLIIKRTVTMEVSSRKAMPGMVSLVKAVHIQGCGYAY
jgi:hypothetical protein